MLGFLLCLRSFTYGLIHMSLGFSSGWGFVQNTWGRGSEQASLLENLGEDRWRCTKLGQPVAALDATTPNLNQEALPFQMTCEYPLLSMI